MANMFQAKRGTLIKGDPDATPSIVEIDGLPKEVDLMMLTEIRVERNQVTQYLKTLDNHNFGYAWGEGPGTIFVSGLIFFNKNCSNSGDSAGMINSYYEENNVYNKNSATKIGIGTAVYEGYLEKMQIEASQNEFNYGNFSFQFTILPK